MTTNEDRDSLAEIIGECALMLLFLAAAVWIP